MLLKRTRNKRDRRQNKLFQKPAARSQSQVDWRHDTATKMNGAIMNAAKMISAKLNETALKLTAPKKKKLRQNERVNMNGYEMTVA